MENGPAFFFEMAALTGHDALQFSVPILHTVSTQSAQLFDIGVAA